MSPGSGEHTSSNRRPAIVTFCPELEAPVAGSRHLIERAIALAGRAEVLLVGRSLRRTGRGNDAPRVSRVRAAGSEIELLRLASAPRLAPRSLVEAMALRTLLRDLRRENRLDLLDVIGSGPGCAEALWIAHRLGVPVSVTVAGAADPTAAPKGRVLRRADRVICANESAAGALRAIGVREPAIVREAVAARYRPLVRADCRDQLGLVRERPLVLCVADLEPGAGQDELFRAVAAMPVPGPQRPIVALVGDGSARSSLGNLAADLDLSDHVCFEGDPHLDGLPLYYGAANLVVKEPGREGGDRSEREALACGRKVVATNLDSLRDALEELLVEPSPGPSGVAPIDRDWNDVAQELLDLWRVLLPRRPIGGGRFESGQAEGDRARSLLRMGFRAQHSSSFRDQGAGAAGGLAAFQGLTDAEIGTKTDAERSEDYAQQVPGAGPTTCVGSAPDHRINKTPHPPFSEGWTPITGRTIVYHHRTQGSGVEGVHIRGVAGALRRLGAVVNLIEPPGVHAFGIGESETKRRRRSSGSGRVERSLRRFASAAPAWGFSAAEIGYNIMALPKLLHALRGGDRLLYERYALFGFAGALAASGRAPLLLEVNDATVIERSRKTAWRSLARAIELSVLRSAARIVVVSDTIRLRLLGLGLDPRRIITVQNASDAPSATPERREAIRRRFGGDAPVLAGVCGAFLPWHGLDLVVEALAKELRSGELGLIFVGDGPVRATIETLARKLGVENRVVFTGRVPAAEVSWYLSALDIALLPDVAPHASPMKLFEYMAHGLAIVAPDIASIRSVAEAGRSAELFKRGDRAALRRAVRALIDDPPMRRELAKGSSDRWAEAHTWDRNAQRAIGPIESKRDWGETIHRGSCTERPRPC